MGAKSKLNHFFRDGQNNIKRALYLSLKLRENCDNDNDRQILKLSRNKEFCAEMACFLQEVKSLTIEDFLFRFDCKIKFYIKKKLYKTSGEENAGYIVNLEVLYPFSNVSEINNQTVIYYIYNLKAYGTEQNPPQSAYSLLFRFIEENCDQDPGDLIRSWRENFGEGPIRFKDEPKFKSHFGFGFCLIQRRGENLSQFKFEYIYCSRYWVGNSAVNDLKLVSTFDWPVEKLSFDLNDKFVPSLGKFITFKCYNHWCHQQFRKKQCFLRHILHCSDKVEYELKATIKTDLSGASLVKSLGLLPSDFYHKGFMSFDIETFGKKSERQMFKSKILNFQSVASLAINKNYGIQPRTKFFARENDTRESLLSTIEDFFKTINQWVLEYNQLLPPVIDDAIDLCQNVLDSTKHDKNRAVKVRIKYQQALRYLKGLKKCCVFSFNGEKFDCPSIIPSLLEVLNLPSNQLRVVKRGSGFMTIETPSFKMLDVRNFSGGGSLSNFAKTWGCSLEKSIFPYEKYTNMSEVEADGEFPLYSEFKSSLKAPKTVSESIKIIKSSFRVLNLSLHQFLSTFELEKYVALATSDLESFLWSENLCEWYTVNPVQYVEAKALYEANFTNMLKYLQHYNKLDVEVLTEAFEKYCENYRVNYQLNPLDYVSLPAMSESNVWQLYDKSINVPVTLGENYKHIFELMKDSVLGGPSIVFGRHVEINQPPNNFPTSVNLLPSGDQVKNLIGLDANSKYTE